MDAQPQQPGDALQQMHATLQQQAAVMQQQTAQLQQQAAQLTAIQASHSQEVQSLQQQLAAVQVQVQQIAAAAAAPVGPAPAPRPKQLKTPNAPMSSGLKPDPEEWTARIELMLCANGYQLSSPATVHTVAACLEGPALVWYLRERARVGSGQEPRPDWPAFKAAFCAAFQVRDPATVAREALDRNRQTASAADHAARFGAYVLRLPQLDEGSKVHIFLKGLKV